MKKVIIKVCLLVTLTAIGFGCGDSFLNQAPKAALDPASSAKGVEGLLIGSYALLDGFTTNVATDPYKVAQSNWVFGSIAGGEATKGSDSGDQPDINEVETFSVSANNQYDRVKWASLYDGVYTANSVIKAATGLPESEITPPKRLKLIAEARALRGFYHLEAKKIWDKAPYLDENTDPYTVTNDADIWPMIEADFQFAADNLKEKSTSDAPMEIGRWNKWAAKAFLGKVQLYRKNYAAAEATLQDVYDNGVTPAGVAYGLNDQFRKAFNGNNDNSKESVMSVQYTGADGSGGINASAGEVLNFPNGGKFGAPTNCCGFYQPTHEFVNSFRTDASGLPYLDGSYNSDALEIPSDESLNGGGGLVFIPSPAEIPAPTTAIYIPDGGATIDPRLDWTVGRRGVPYLDWGVHPGMSWIRDATNGGPFSPKKHVFNKADVGVFTDASSWTAGFATNNYYLMRFSDLILLLAEAKIENSSPDLSGAVDLIDEVRSRAANPAGFVPGSPATYSIGTYGSFTDVAQARAALHMERKLELGMEGHRFFDLVRWGAATTELTSYINYEKKWRPFLKTSVSFVPAEDNYYPIPQRQIDLTNGLLKQNR